MMEERGSQMQVIATLRAHSYPGETWLRRLGISCWRPRVRNRLAHQHAACQQTIAVFSTFIPSRLPVQTSHTKWQTDFLH
jgi:hypothetical protein